MTGKTISTVLKCDNQVEFRFTDGTCLRIGWRDGDGELLNGEPDIIFEGTHVIAKPTIIDVNRLRH